MAESGVLATDIANLLKGGSFLSKASIIDNMAAPLQRAITRTNKEKRGFVPSLRHSLDDFCNLILRSSRGGMRESFISKTSTQN